MKQKPKTSLPALFVAGTDTGVGKTVISLLLMHLFKKKGACPVYLKPFQTGCVTPMDRDSDARFIRRHTGGDPGGEDPTAVRYCYSAPKAPWFAARARGERPALSAAADFIRSRRSPHTPLIVEGAGGLLVPVNEGRLLIDLMADLATDGVTPILVARADLGTINHTLLSVEALRSRQISPLGIVLSDCGPEPVPDTMIRENIEAIQTFSGIPVGGVVNAVTDFSHPGPEALAPLSALLRRLPHA